MYVDVISSNFRNAYIQLGINGCNAGYLFDWPLLSLHLKIYRWYFVDSFKYQQREVVFEIENEIAKESIFIINFDTVRGCGSCGGSGCVFCY